MILVVDDEQDICRILKFNLELGGFEVMTASSAEEAASMDLTSVDLILLDVMMDGMSGFDFAKRLKADPQTREMPIIFITAKDTENDILTGLGIGADDYISKPFSVSEVILRVKAVLRRSSRHHASDTVSYKDIRLDLEAKTVSVAGMSVPFTRTEFEILHLLLSNPGKVFSRQDILSRIWPDDVLVLDRTVDVNITRIRKKISPYSRHIATRSGYGYYFEP